MNFRKRIAVRMHKEELGTPELETPVVPVTTEAIQPVVPQAPSVDYSKFSIAQLARVISKDWKKIYFGAKPYLSAMYSIDNIRENYGMDSGVSVVIYFLANASGWRGQVAKDVKKELNRRVNGARR